MKKYSKIESYANRYHAQAGMTLIELTVVLLILIGLAGLMIPYVSGFAEKTHDATTASTIGELNNTLGRFHAQRMTYPDNLEALVDTAGTAYNKLITTGLFTATTLPATGASSLAKVGLTNVIYNDNATSDATFKSTGSNTSTVLVGDTSKVAYVAPGAGWVNGGTASVASHLSYALGGSMASYANRTDGLSAIPAALQTAVTTATTNKTTADAALAACTLAASCTVGVEDVAATTAAAALTTATAALTTATQGAGCYDYVGFGIGDGNEMVGAAMQSAPVLFTPNGDTNPTKKYSRFIAVFKVNTKTAFDGTCPDAVQPAKFVGTVANMDFAALVGSSASLAWSNSRLITN